MNKEEMKPVVLDYINENDVVSYAELSRLFEQNEYDYKGEIMACSDQCEHVVFWTGWNEEAYNMLGELIQEGLIHREPTQFLTYMIDGAALTFPLVKKATYYKTDHWLPVVFCKGQDGGKCSRKN